MKKLTHPQLPQVNAGTSENKDNCSNYESFKKEISDAYHSCITGIGDGSTKLAEKINDLLEKHKK